MLRKRWAEALQLALSSSHCLMRVFCPIILCALTRCTVLPGERPGRQTLAPAGSTRGGSGTTRSGSTAFPGAAPTCRERKSDGTGEKLDAGNRHVQFDERRLETELRCELRHRHLDVGCGAALVIL